MKKALGFVETRGFVAAISAADAMLKTADIHLAGKEIIDPGIVLIKITGDPLSVQYAVEAGAAAADRLGLLISSQVISEPDEQLSILLPELFEELTIVSEKTSEISVPYFAKTGENNVKARVKKNIENQDKSGLPVLDKPIKEDASGSIPGSIEKYQRPRKKIEKETLDPDNKKEDTESISPVLLSESILPGTDDQPAIPGIERKENESVKTSALSDENSRVNHTFIKDQQNTVDHITDEIIAPVEETSKQIRKARTKKELTGHATLFDSANDTIARLKREALGVTDQAPELNEIKPVNQEHHAPSTIINPEEIADDLLSLNVHLLRKRARSIEGFPIHGREISKANREQLINYFSVKK